MSVTPTTEESTNPTGTLRTVDLAAAFAADMEAHDGQPASYDETPPPTEPAATPAKDGREAAEDATPAKDAAPKATKPQSAPADDEPVTLTKAELALLRRQANDQSRTAQEKAALEKEVKRLTLESNARNYALGKLANDGAERYLTRADVLEEEQRIRNYVDNTLSQENEAIQAATIQQQQFAAAKNQSALALYNEAMVEIVAEGAALGFSRQEIGDLVAEKIDTDPDIADFQEEFKTARDLATAQRAAKRAYRELTKILKADFQARKIKQIEDETPEPTKRPQVHGRSPGGQIDPLDKLPLAERSRARLDRAFEADGIL